MTRLTRISKSSQSKPDFRYYPTVSVSTNCFVKPQMFSIWRRVSWSKHHHTWHGVITDESNKNVFMLEVGCCFDSCLGAAYLNKACEISVSCTANLWFWLQVTISCIHIWHLGHVHNRVTRGLRMVGDLRKWKQNSWQSTVPSHPWLEVTTFGGEGAVYTHTICCHMFE